MGKDEVEVDELASCLETQLTEIETIACIFTEDEYKPVDEETTAKIRDLCLKFRQSSDNDSKTIAEILKGLFDVKCLSFDLKISVSDHSCSDQLPLLLNINFLLPHNYPNELPKVYISSDQLSRAEQSAWNDGLCNHIQRTNTGNPIVYDIVEWVRESCAKYIDQREAKNSISDILMNKKQSDIGIQQHGNMWLYMHHIYNKNKRKDIINWAKELELTGFSLPGKPGVVYVEGLETNIDDFFARLKRLSWKRMSCIQKDSFTVISRKFGDFQELNFDAHGARDYHMDMGKFHIFLKDHELGSMFTVLFGLKDN